MLTQLKLRRIRSGKRTHLSPTGPIFITSEKQIGLARRTELDNTKSYHKNYNYRNVRKSKQSHAV